jgi:hypothetical protein
MLKSFPIKKRNGAHLVKKKCLKKKTCPLLRFQCFEHAKTLNWFVFSFEHVNFAINGKYSKNIMTILTSMFPLWSFKHIKM